MDKETWNKVKKDINTFPVREKLLYLKEILKKVKEKDLATEIINEIKKAQEIIDNEEAPEEKIQVRNTPLRRDEEPQRKNRETLEEELLNAKMPEIATVHYGITQELEKGNLYGRDTNNSLYEQKPYESSNELYESPTQVDMMKESERRLDEYSAAKNSSLLEQESVNKKKTYLR